ncbi:MAG: hypothetical protein WC824_07230 [Bacteroidota bacterium]|jgi:hypothetical protein
MDANRHTIFLRILSFASAAARLNLASASVRRIHFRVWTALVLSLLSTLPVAAQQDSTGTAGPDTNAVAEQRALSWYETTLTPAMFMAPMIVYRTADIPVTGFLREVRNDSVYLESAGTITPIPFRDMMKLQLPRQKQASAAAVHGMLVGAYLSDLMLWTKGNHPGYYADIQGKDGLFFLSNLLFAAASGGISYLIGLPSATAEEQFLFAENAEERRAEEVRFLALVRGTHSGPRLHVTVQMSFVRPLHEDRAATVLREAGFTPEVPSPLGGNDHDRTPLNLLRKAQLTCGFLPSVAVGAAYMSLSESADYQTGSAIEGDLEHRLVMKNELNAGLAVFTFEPLRSLHTSPYSWLLGAGAGIVFSSGEADASTVDRTSATSLKISDTESLDKNLFGATIFTELRADLYPTLSIGLTAEYVHINPLPIGPLDGINTTSSTLDMSSTSWGVVIGLHF